MTCGYMRDVATANTWTFFKLLLRWKGSVWKSIHMELIVWLFVFVNMRTAYEFFMLGTEAAATYEHVVHRCREISGKCRTVMTFAIGFFVTYVSTRWWNIFMTIPWPDTCALQLTAFLRVRQSKYEQEDRLFRQNIMRYLWLSYVLVFRDVSVRIKKRFPSVKSMTPTLLTQEEMTKLKSASREMQPWVPIEWILDYLRSAKKKCLLDEFHYIELNQTVLAYRQQLHEILSHDCITVPLVYVQSVHICTICYFLITCFASQTIHTDHKNWEGVIDFYLPVYAVIEFIVFVGWLKTAFVMLNPFGMDDDDFEMNALIERNMMVSLSYINDFYNQPPKLVDMKVCLPTNLQDVVRENANPMRGSAVPVKMTRVDHAMVDDPKISNFMSQVLPSDRASTSALASHRPINEFPNIANSAAITIIDDDDKKEKEYKNPDNSAQETDKQKFSKQEDLEAVVKKMLDKKLAEVQEEKEERKEEEKKEEVKKEEKEKVKSLSPEPTQKSWNQEEATQKTWVDEGGPSVLQKKISKIRPRPSKADVRAASATPLASARKPLVSTKKKPTQNAPPSTLNSPQVPAPPSTAVPPSDKKKKEKSKENKKEASVLLEVESTQSGEKSK